MLIDMGCGASIEHDPNVMYGSHQNANPRVMTPARNKLSRQSKHRLRNENNNNQEKYKENQRPPSVTTSIDSSGSRLGPTKQSNKGHVILTRDLYQRQQSCLDRDEFIRKKRRRQFRKAHEFASRNDRENLSMSTMSRSRTTSVTDSMFASYVDMDSTATSYVNLSQTDDTIMEETVESTGSGKNPLLRPKKNTESADQKVLFASKHGENTNDNETNSRPSGIDIADQQGLNTEDDRASNDRPEDIRDSGGKVYKKNNGKNMKNGHIMMSKTDNR